MFSKVQKSTLQAFSIFLLGLVLAYISQFLIHKPDLFLYVSTYTFLFALLLTGLSSNRELFWPLLVAPFLLQANRVLSMHLLERVSDHLEIEQSVGLSSYLGAAKSVEMTTFHWTFLLCVATGVALSSLTKPKQTSIELNAESGKSTDWAVLLLAIGVYAVASFPHLRDSYDGLATTIHSTNWDQVNFDLWRYMVFRGWLPFLDFWYPYCGNYNQMSPFPADLLRVYLHNLIIASVFLISVYSLTGRRKGWSLFICALIVLLVQTGIILSTRRYFIALEAVLIYSVLRQQPIRSRKHWVGYGIFLGWGFSFEPNQILYAIPVLGVQTVLDLYRQPTRETKLSLLKSQGAAFLTFGLWTGAFVIWLFLRGQLPGFIDFYREMNALGVATSIPTGLAAWFKYSFELDHVLLIVLQIFAFVGTYLAFGCLIRTDRRSFPNVGDLIFSIALLGFVVFHKQLIRPHMATQMIDFFYIGGLIALPWVALSWTRFQKWLVYFALGGITGILLQSPLVFSSVSEALGHLSKLPSDIGVLLKPASEIRVQTSAYFSPATYKKDQPLAVDILDYVKRLRTSAHQPRIYVLGDESLLYILMGQKPPYHTTYLDMADIHAQEGVVYWLEETKPELVFWVPENRQMDSVPNIVRNSILFDYAVRSFEWKETQGRFQILVPRSTQHPVNVNYWATELGRTIDLGSLPIDSSLSKHLGCGQNEPSCVTFLEVTTPDLTADPAALPKEGKWRVKVDVGNEKFEVLFSPRAGHRKYAIYLDRIWFWGALRRSGLSPHLAESGQNSALKLSLISKKPNADILY